MKSSFSPAITILWFIFYLYILNWLIKIEQCKCADIPEGASLKEWFTFFVIFQLIWFFVYLFVVYNTEYIHFMIYMVAALIILGITNIVYMIYTIIYIKKLKEINCNCGSEFQQNVIYSILIINFSLIALGIVLSMIYFITNYAFSK